jgi:hypothetical protein
VTGLKLKNYARKTKTLAVEKYFLLTRYLLMGAIKRYLARYFYFSVKRYVINVICLGLDESRADLISFIHR